MNTVIETINSVFERDKLLNFLDRFLQNIYNLNIDAKSMISTGLPQSTAESLIGYLGHELEVRDVEGILAKCIELEHALDQVPVVGLTITFEPSQEYVLQISDMLFKATKEKKFVSIKIDKSLIAGAVVEGNGAVFSETVKQYFERKGMYGL